MSERRTNRTPSVLPSNTNPRRYSPLGDQRERSVSCNTCHQDTWNYKGTCDTCMDRAENAAPKVETERTGSDS